MFANCSTQCRQVDEIDLFRSMGVSVGDMFIYLATTGNASNSCESDTKNEVDKRMEITLNILFSK